MKKFILPIINIPYYLKCYKNSFVSCKYGLSKLFNQNNTSNQIDSRQGDAEEKQELFRKRKKVALLLAYNGEKYHGVMMNRGDRSYPTIEKELILALLKAELIPEKCWKKPPLMHFVIASRTDKGVSTCGQVISLFLEYQSNVVDLINSHLPSDVRVLAVQRTTKGFSCWRYASSRVYTYTLPTFAFANRPELNDGFRISSNKLKHIHSLGYRYKGAHSFHNFTPVSYMGNNTAIRKIIDFEVGMPFLKESIEFVTLKFTGQSFLLHQIRHMVGLIIAIVSERAREDLYVRAFSEVSVKIPFAPSSGLILEKIFFEGYNRYYQHERGDLSFSSVQDQIDHFRETKIMPSLYRNEIKNKNMLNWLNLLDSAYSPINKVTSTLGNE